MSRVHLPLSSTTLRHEAPPLTTRASRRLPRQAATPAAEKTAAVDTVTLRAPHIPGTDNEAAPTAAAVDSSYWLG